MTIPAGPEDGGATRTVSQNAPARRNAAAPAASPFRADGWTEDHAQALLEHIGRLTIHGSFDRNFAHAWTREPETGVTKPRLYPISSPWLERCQYAALTHRQHAAVVVVDIDAASNVPGGSPEAIHGGPRGRLADLVSRDAGPAWIGVNPASGKAQVLWMIDPVFAGRGGLGSKNMRLLKRTAAELTRALGGDSSFSHYFSRWPLYVGDDPTAYRWHHQHDRVDRLSDLLQEARMMASVAAGGPEVPSREVLRAPADRRYESGRDRIVAVRKAREEAVRLRELDGELTRPQDVAPAAFGVVEGVRVFWVHEGRAARDQTAFHHALDVARQLRANGEVMRDEKLVDAYEAGYRVAQSVGADGREPEMPDLAARLATARRVRAYASQGKPRVASTGKDGEKVGYRKSLATMGARGGKKTVARRAENPEEREALRQGWERANKKRARAGAMVRAQILAYAVQELNETDRMPTRKELADRFDVSTRTVTKHLADLRSAGMLDPYEPEQKKPR